MSAIHDYMSRDSRGISPRKILSLEGVVTSNVTYTSHSCVQPTQKKFNITCPIKPIAHSESFIILRLGKIPEKLESTRPPQVNKFITRLHNLLEEFKIYITK